MPRVATRAVFSGQNLAASVSRAVAAGLAGAALWCAPQPAAAGPVSGVVSTVGRPGVAAAPSVVYAEPIDSTVSRQGGRFTLRQKNKTFTPRLLGVPAGSSVDFPNDDSIFHNVFSLSGPQPFDLGLYRSGESQSRMFAQSGTYRVFCNIHPNMSALILVVPTPYVTVAAADGRFVLDLPPGRYRLTAVSERAAAVSIEVTAQAGATQAPALTLDESAWLAVQHKNKFGKDYPAANYRR
jgi:plastocyanin